VPREPGHPADARALDIGEHRDQRHFELAIDGFQLIGDEQRRQPGLELAARSARSPA
jgi:hypothetical protein